MNVTNNKQRTRRLRKKLHLGEFKELGFAFESKFSTPLTIEKEDALVDSFLSEVVEPRSLALGGWITGGFIAFYGRGSATEEDRESVRDWLMARSELSDVRVEPLSDAWYIR